MSKKAETKKKKYAKMLLYGFICTLALFIPEMTPSATSISDFQTNGRQVGAVFEGLYVYPKKVINNSIAWTTDPGVGGYDGNTADIIPTTVLNHNTQLQSGHHYYTDYPELIYIGRWENELKRQEFYACIHGKDKGTKLDFQDGSGYIGNKPEDNLNICGRQYNTAYWGYCSDCGRPVLLNVYARANTLKNINMVPNKSYYYYLCPYSIQGESASYGKYTRGHLEQGAPFAHQCPKMQSVNRYQIKFNSNFVGAQNSKEPYITDKWYYYMTDTSTSTITYEGTSLSFSSGKAFPDTAPWVSYGYIFKGWKTSDGTAVKNYAELLKWYKDKSPSTLETNENTLEVYADWTSMGLTLRIDYGTGTVNDVAVKYNESYNVGIAPNSSYTVTFNAGSGATFLSGGTTATSTRTFRNWQKISTASQPFRGQFDEVSKLYKNTVNANGVTTVLRAEYTNEAITLPSVSRAGYAFLGWYNGSTFIGYGGGSYVPTSNVTLTAKWQDNKIVLNAKQNGQTTDISWNYNNQVWSTIYTATKNDAALDMEQTTTSPSTATITPDSSTKTYTVNSKGIYNITLKGTKGTDTNDNYKGGNGSQIVYNSVFLEPGDIITASFEGGGTGKGGGQNGGTSANVKISSYHPSWYVGMAAGGGGASSKASGKAADSDNNAYQTVTTGESPTSGAGGGSGWYGGKGGTETKEVAHTHLAKPTNKQDNACWTYNAASEVANATVIANIYSSGRGYPYGDSNDCWWGSTGNEDAAAYIFAAGGDNVSYGNDGGAYCYRGGIHSQTSTTKNTDSISVDAHTSGRPWNYTNASHILASMILKSGNFTDADYNGKISGTVTISSDAFYGNNSKVSLVNASTGNVVDSKIISSGANSFSFATTKGVTYRIEAYAYWNGTANAWIGITLSGMSYKSTIPESYTLKGTCPAIDTQADYKGASGGKSYVMKTSGWSRILSDGVLSSISETTASVKITPVSTNFPTASSKTGIPTPDNAAPNTIKTDTIKKIPLYKNANDYATHLNVYWERPSDVGTDYSFVVKANHFEGTNLITDATSNTVKTNAMSGINRFEAILRRNDNNSVTLYNNGITKTNEHGTDGVLEIPLLEVEQTLTITYYDNAGNSKASTITIPSKIIPIICAHSPVNAYLTWSTNANKYYLDGVTYVNNSAGSPVVSFEAKGIMNEYYDCFPFEMVGIAEENVCKHAFLKSTGKEFLVNGDSSLDIVSSSAQAPDNKTYITKWDARILNEKTISYKAYAKGYCTECGKTNENYSTEIKICGDKTAPTITDNCTFTAAYLDTKFPDVKTTQEDTYWEYGWVNTQLTLNYSATDSASGIKSFALYQGESVVSTGTVYGKNATISYTVPEDGVLEYRLIVEDNVGNKTTVNLCVRKDTSGPNRDIVVKTNNASTSNYVSLKMSDYASGLDSYYWGTSSSAPTSGDYWTKIPTENTTSFETDKEISTSGNHYLFVKDKCGNISSRAYVTSVITNLNATGGLHGNYGKVSPTYVLTFSSINGIDTNCSFTIPTATRKGYDFTGWYDKEIGGTYKYGQNGTCTPKSNGTLYAHWVARDDTPYKVNHWIQKVTDSFKSDSETKEYILVDTDNLKGTTDAFVTPPTKPLTGKYEGCIAPPLQTKYIDCEGTMVIDYYYDRTKVVLDVNGKEVANQVLGNTNGLCTFDMYVNDIKVADDVTDYWSNQILYGSTWEVKGIKPINNKNYKGADVN